MTTRNDQPRPEDFNVTCDIAIRFRDLDAMGHVNNAVYATYFEVARGHYMKALGLWCESSLGMAERFPFILLDLYIRFVSPAEIDDRLRVHVRTTRVGGKSFDFEYLLTALGDGRTIAVGRSVQVYYDYRVGRTAPLPDDVRAAVEALDGVSAHP